MNAIEKQRRDALKQREEEMIRRLCLSDKTEAGLAYRVAEAMNRELAMCDALAAADAPDEAYPSRPTHYTTLLYSGPRFMRAVADALEDKPRFQPTPTCLNIVKAWNAACDCALRDGRRPNGDILMNGPTLYEVKREFVRLVVPEKERPPDWCSRENLTPLSKTEWEARKADRSKKTPPPYVLKLPPRQTLEKTCKRLRLPLCKDPVRRPRYSQPK